MRFSKKQSIEARTSTGQCTVSDYWGPATACRQPRINLGNDVTTTVLFLQSATLGKGDNNTVLESSSRNGGPLNLSKLTNRNTGRPAQRERSFTVRQGGEVTESNLRPHVKGRALITPSRYATCRCLRVSQRDQVDVTLMHCFERQAATPSTHLVWAFGNLIRRGSQYGRRFDFQGLLCLMVGWMSHLCPSLQNRASLISRRRASKRKKAGTNSTVHTPPIFLRITSPYSTVTVMSLSEVHAHAPRPSTSLFFALSLRFESRQDIEWGLSLRRAAKTAMSRLAASSLRHSREREREERSATTTTLSGHPKTSIHLFEAKNHDPS